jgi:hypothetical protein
VPPDLTGFKLNPADHFFSNLSIYSNSSIILSNINILPVQAEINIKADSIRGPVFSVHVVN